ncbi:MAG: hypothetical protein JXB05_20420 [Myxococcaceae bacterium]|nr:hypothetical protein [Myxococcaceae bacterium]
MQDIDLEGLLEIISGNVVGERRHQDILRVLIAGPVGTWMPATGLDRAGLLAEEARGFSSELGPKLMEGLRLTWTLNPDDPDDRAFCAILFFYGRDDLMWHRLALFNRNTL